MVDMYLDIGQVNLAALSEFNWNELEVWRVEQLTAETEP